MKLLTEKEIEAILLILRDFSSNYNANSISKRLGITSRGALKLLKHLQREDILIGRQMGKATFYRVNFEDIYTLRLIEALLIKHSNDNAKRWVDEFREISANAQITLLFGSIARKRNDARDVDLLIVINIEKYKVINKIIEKKREIMYKPLHKIVMTLADLERNLRSGNPAMINAIREGYVLSGHDKAIEVLKNVTGKK